MSNTYWYENDSEFEDPYYYIYIYGGYPKWREDSEFDELKKLEKQAMEEIDLQELRDKRREKAQEFHEKCLENPHSIFNLIGMHFTEFTSEKILFKFIPHDIDSKYMCIERQYNIYLKYDEKFKRWILRRNQCPDRSKVIDLFSENITDEKLIPTIYAIHEILLKFVINLKDRRMQRELLFAAGDISDLNSDEEKIFLTETQLKKRRRHREKIWRRMLPPSEKNTQSVRQTDIFALPDDMSSSTSSSTQSSNLLEDISHRRNLRDISNTEPDYRRSKASVLMTLMEEKYGNERANKLLSPSSTDSEDKRPRKRTTKTMPKRTVRIMTRSQTKKNIVTKRQENTSSRAHLLENEQSTITKSPYFSDSENETPKEEYVKERTSKLLSTSSSDSEDESPRKRITKTKPNRTVSSAKTSVKRQTKTQAKNKITTRSQMKSSTVSSRQTQESISARSLAKESIVTKSPYFSESENIPLAEIYGVKRAKKLFYTSSSDSEGQIKDFPTLKRTRKRTTSRRIASSTTLEEGKKSQTRKRSSEKERKITKSPYFSDMENEPPKWLESNESLSSITEMSKLC